MATPKNLDQPSSVKTNKQTRFKKCVSGNPSGRPKSIHSAEALRQQILAGTPKLIDMLFQQAYEDNGKVIKLLLERAVPIVKPQFMPISIQLDGDSLASQLSSLFNSAAQGKISIETALELSRIAEIALSATTQQAALSPEKLELIDGGENIQVTNLPSHQAISITLPQLHAGQIQIAQHPSRRKLVCCGRRWGEKLFSDPPKY